MTGEKLCRACGTRPVGDVPDETSLCDRCADRRPAAAAGQPELPDPPPATAFPGPDGWWHERQLRLRQVLLGILAEAPASNLSPGDGYHVDVMVGHDANVDTLLAALRERVGHEISRSHLRRVPDHPCWTLTPDEVAGRLVSDDTGDAPYAVVIDGRKLSWNELGRA